MGIFDSSSNCEFAEPTGGDMQEPCLVAQHTQHNFDSNISDLDHGMIDTGCPEEQTLCPVSSYLP